MLGPAVRLPDRHNYLLPNPDFIGLGLEVMGLMRSSKEAVLDLHNPGKLTGEEIYGIGGGVDQTTIDASGVSTRTIIVWPDEVGRKITPDQKGATCHL